MTALCQRDGCIRPVLCRGYCAAHYEYARRHRLLEPLPSCVSGRRLKSRAHVGFGQARRDRTGTEHSPRIPAGQHPGRFALTGSRTNYWWHQSRKGLTIDHLCNVPLCVNPSHMEPVTNLENISRRSRRTA